MSEYTNMKPCPFCGGRAKLLHGKPNQQKEGMAQAFIQCSTCKAKTKTFIHLPYQAWLDVERCAVEAWERRADNG